jgi:hypothetical protein
MRSWLLEGTSVSVMALNNEHDVPFGCSLNNKWLCHERLYLENKVLHFMFYYERKVILDESFWLYERSTFYFFTFVLKNKVF